MQLIAINSDNDDPDSNNEAVKPMTSNSTNQILNNVRYNTASNEHQNASNNDDEDDIIEIPPPTTQITNQQAKKNNISIKFKENRPASINTQRNNRDSISSNSSNSNAGAVGVSGVSGGGGGGGGGSVVAPVRAEHSNNNHLALLNHGSNNSASSRPSSRSSAESTNTSDELDSSEDSKVKIGPEYQADFDEKAIVVKNKNEIQGKEMETILWRPTNLISDKDIENYLIEASNRRSYNIEQGLGILFWNNYNIRTALFDSNRYMPYTNVWSKEDTVLFETAYNFHGKNFIKIKQMLPDKSLANLINYYYTTKKMRTFVSLIDQLQSNTKMPNNLSSLDLNDNPNDALTGTSFNNGSSGANNNNLLNDNDASDNDLSVENDSNDENFTGLLTKICCNCDFITSELQSTPKGMLCNPCYLYYKNTSGLMRPDFTVTHKNSSHNYVPKTNRYMNMNNTNEANKPNNQDASSLTSNNATTTTINQNAKNFHKTLRKPPKGLYLNYDDLVSFAESDSDSIFEVLNRRILHLKIIAQRNKQEITAYINKISKSELKVSLDEEMLQLDAETIPTPTWTPREIALVLQGFNKYGSDFESISKVMGSKTEGSIRAFYNYHKDNYNLDKIVINNAKDLDIKANTIYNNLNMLNLPDIPVESATVNNLNLVTTCINNNNSFDEKKLIAESFINEEYLTTAKPPQASTTSLIPNSNSQLGITSFNDSNNEDIIFITND